MHNRQIDKKLKIIFTIITMFSVCDITLTTRTTYIINLTPNLTDAVQNDAVSTAK